MVRYEGLAACLFGSRVGEMRTTAAVTPAASAITQAMKMTSPMMPKTVFTRSVD